MAKLSQQKQNLLDTIKNMDLNTIIEINNELAECLEDRIYDSEELEEELDLRFDNTLDKIIFGQEYATCEFYRAAFWKWDVYGYVRMLTKEEVKEYASNLIEECVQYMEDDWFIQAYEVFIEIPYLLAQWIQTGEI